MRRRWALSEEDAHELREHLVEVIPDVDPQGADVEAAVAAIDFAAQACVSSMTPRQWRQLWKAEHAHKRAVLDAAERLRTLLAIERPLYQTAGLNWPALDAALVRVTESARAEAECYRPQVGPGAPADEWRDRLISVIFSVYPTGEATKARGSHFEQTVEMVLGYLGRDIEDVHGVILAALRRRPDPPFVVTTTAH